MRGKGRSARQGSCTLPGNRFVGLAWSFGMLRGCQAGSGSCSGSIEKTSISPFCSFSRVLLTSRTSIFPCSMTRTSCSGRSSRSPLGVMSISSRRSGGTRGRMRAGRGPVLACPDSRSGRVASIAGIASVARICSPNSRCSWFSESPQRMMHQPHSDACPPLPTNGLPTEA